MACAMGVGTACTGDWLLAGSPCCRVSCQVVPLGGGLLAPFLLTASSVSQISGKLPTAIPLKATLVATEGSQSGHRPGYLNQEGMRAPKTGQDRTSLP